MYYNILHSSAWEYMHCKTCMHQVSRFRNKLILCIVVLLLLDTVALLKFKASLFTIETRTHISLCILCIGWSSFTHCVVYVCLNRGQQTLSYTFTLCLFSVLNVHHLCIATLYIWQVCLFTFSTGAVYYVCEIHRC